MILSFELPDWKFHRVIACLIAVAPGTYSNECNSEQKNISASDHQESSIFFCKVPLHRKAAVTITLQEPQAAIKMMLMPMQ